MTLKQLLPTGWFVVQREAWCLGCLWLRPPERRVDIHIAQDQRLHHVVANTLSPVTNLEAGPPEDEELA